MKNKVIKNPTIAIVMVFLLFLLASSLSYLLFFFQIKKMEANTKLGELDLSHLLVEEIEEKIEERAEQLEKKGLIFNYQGKELKIPAKVIAFDSEMSYELFSIERQASLEKVLDNQTKNLFFRLFPQLSNKKNEITKAEFRFHQERYQQTLDKLFIDYEVKVTNAYFSFNQENQLIIVSEKFGIRLDQEANLDQVRNHLANLSLEEIPLVIKEIKPEVFLHDLRGKENLVIELLENNNFILSYQEETWTLPKEELVEWIMIDKSMDEELVLNQKKIEDYLEFDLAPQIDRPAQLPEFNIEEDKVKDWQPGASGRKLIISDSAENIRKNLLKEEKIAELIIEETMYEEVEGLAKEIKEIIGTGHSNFAGSPYNRIHNIRVGANNYHGLMIAPGEEFSTLENLGTVDASTGYLPELVIKEGKTIPEYGGGLCQISTTLFRTALQSGLLITARQPHSFRVSYYEPAGTDASIYNPWPDLKFINDTEHHILIQARIEGANLYFDFWGTNDGRQVEVGKPVIYNIVAPPPTKYIETDELEAGEIKCTENAHNGANTHFDYTVIYPDEEKVEERFYSYYVPWQEVCLIGQEEEEEEEDEEEQEEDEEAEI